MAYQCVVIFSKRVGGMIYDNQTCRQVDDKHAKKYIKDLEKKNQAAGRTIYFDFQIKPIQ